MAVVEHPTTWYEDIVDGIGRFQAVIPECVRDEMEKLASGQGRRSRTARAALEIASGFTTFPCGKASVDDEVLSGALSEGAAIASVDTSLVRSARASHLKTVTLRGGRVSIQ